MASKLAVACIGATVIIISITMLVIESLSSPSQCRQKDETKTERGSMEKPEPASVSTETSVLVPKATVPSHSTARPLSRVSFSTKTPHLPSRDTSESDSAPYPISQMKSTSLPSSEIVISTFLPDYSTNSTSSSSSRVISPKNSTPHLSSIDIFEMNATIYPSSELIFSTNSVTRFSSVGSIRQNSVTHRSSEDSSLSTSGIHSSSLSSTSRPFLEGTSKPTIHSSLGTASPRSLTSEVTPIDQSNHSSSTDFLMKKTDQENEAVFSTRKPTTVFSTMKDGEENISLRGTSQSISEGQIENFFVYDLQTQKGENETVAPGNSHSTYSRTPLNETVFKKIIITPARNCGNGEKRDTFGLCRPVW
jgi:hypothetical protein